MNAIKAIALGADHGGYEMKEELAQHLKSKGYAIQDCGTNSKDSVDYPKYAQAVARAVAFGDCQAGIMVDGAGIGSAMAANKVKGVRAAACYNEALARNSREHNGANVLTLGSGQISGDEAKKIADVFLMTACTEDRHQKRVKMIMEIEGGRAALTLPVSTPTLAESLAPRPQPAPQHSVSQNSTQEAQVDLSAEDALRVTQRVRELIAQEGPGAGPPSLNLNFNVGPEKIAKMIDHTLLKPEASVGDIEKLVNEANTHGFWSVCVNSSYVRDTKKLLRGSNVKLCCVVGFPLGATSPEIKALETRKAIREGADEVDMVINVGALKSGDLETVLQDIRGVASACKERNKLSKVILETALLTDEEKVQACQLSVRAGADFVKTSTGFSSGGATAQDIALMSSCVAHKGLGVKASGGVRAYSDAITMIKAGATRVGASSSIAIVDEAKAIAEGREYIPSKKAKGDY